MKQAFNFLIYLIQNHFPFLDSNSGKVYCSVDRYFIRMFMYYHKALCLGYLFHLEKKRKRKEKREDNLIITELRAKAERRLHSWWLGRVLWFVLSIWGAAAGVLSPLKIFKFKLTFTKTDWGSWTLFVLEGNAQHELLLRDSHLVQFSRAQF